MAARTSRHSTVGECWQPAPLESRLEEGALHVWRADLAAVADVFARLLCTDERTRAERLLGESDRRRWTRARGVLRALLGRYLQADPRDLQIVAEARGKPIVLSDAPGSSATAQGSSGTSSQVAFNLSHSGELALYAFTQSGSVGVDVEVARRPIREVAIAARALGTSAAERLEMLDPTAREQEFRRLWVRHEAKLKCWGTGIGEPSARTSACEPWIADLDVGPRAAAAVAATAPPQRLCCWDWRA